MTDLHGTHPIQRRDPATAARVAREQLSFVVTSAGRSWIVLLLFGVLLTWAAASRGFPAHSFAVLLALLTSSIITGAAWPSRPGSDGRTYFRSLPGSRPRNIAMRTAGAWAVLMLTGAFLSTISHRLGAPIVQPIWSFAAPLVGATVVLLAMSGPMATMKHPAIWVSGIVWVPLLLSRLGGTAVTEALLPILEGKLGLVTLMSGQVLTDGRLLGPAADSAPAELAFALPSWLAASALWLTVSLVIFAVVFTRPAEN